MHIHVDMIGGLAGDMFLAAALDAKLIDQSELEAQLRTLGLGEGIRIVPERVRRGALSGTHIRFEGWDPDADSDHRHLSTIEKMIAESGMDDRVKATATSLFRRLGESEAKVHDMPMERVHFHEVGAVDSILDFCSAAYILETTGATWSHGPVPMGQGSIETAHGTIPVPAPATADLLQGVAAVQRDVEAELVTPTGAAVLRGLHVQGQPDGVVSKIGYGAGTKELGELSNVVRFMVYEGKQVAEPAGLNSPASEVQEEFGLQKDIVTRMECEIDDMNPETLGYVEERLFALGALDVSRVAAHMKKGRIGVRLTVLAKPSKVEQIVWCLLRETSTFGVRVEEISRFILPRRVDQVPTPYGPIRMKIALVDDAPLKAAPEYEDVVAAARKHDVSFNKVYEAAITAYHNG